MIFVTGDTHGLSGLNRIVQACNARKINSGDMIIITGDFGCIWDIESISHNISICELLPCKVLFIDGNHENYSMLSSFPVENWNGGKIHKISNNLIHLMRGQVFCIDGLKILTLGGAESSDKQYRIPYDSWWPEESITKEDIAEAKKNLLRCEKKVDYILSHTCAQKHVTEDMLNRRKDRLVQNSEILLNEVDNLCSYRSWYFGHWHLDIDIRENVHALFNDIVPLI